MSGRQFGNSFEGTLSFVFPPRYVDIRQPALDSCVEHVPYPSLLGPSFTTMYGLSANPFTIHPCAYPRVKPASVHEEVQSKPPATSKTRTKFPSASAVPTPAKTEVNAELKVSLAAKQLSGQTIESKKFWAAFCEKYEKEVASIKHYVGDEVLRQIWREKVEYNGRFNTGENQDDEQFSIQVAKMESCLNQIDEATTLFTAARPQGDDSGHDSRHHHLEKIRAAGVLVIGLARKSMSDRAACKDLLTELSDLFKLIDPKSPTAKVLHRFDKRETQKPANTQEEAAEQRSKENDAEEDTNAADNENEFNQTNPDDQAKENNDEGETSWDK